jgi:nitrogen fixation/metabolism regulation signal transduction histidine kinase
VTSLRAPISRALRSLSIRTKLLLMMLFVLLMSVSALFFLHLESERRLLSQVRDYTDELSTAIDIAQQQPADAADPKATLKALLEAYAARLRRLGVNDVAVTDAADEIQAATNPKLVGRRAVQLRKRGQEWIIKGVLGDEPGPTQKLSTLRVPLLVADRRVGYLLITRQVDDFSEMSRQNLYYRLAVTLAVFGVGMVAAIFLSASFSRPLQDLNQAARRVASGDLGAQVPHAGEDEIGELARTFNEMVEKLRENQKLAERLHFAERSTALGRLASAVAHEIRNPLNFINLSIDHVRNKLAPPDEKRKGEFDRILGGVKDEISRLNRLVVEFLSFGKPMRLNTRRCSMERVLGDVAALVEHKARDQSVTLDLQIVKDLPEIVVDPELLKTCFLNLMINAADAMPAGGTLTVSLRKGAKGAHEALVVTIHDTGHGMTPDEIATAFEPYFSTKETGLGLGLSLTRKIVEDHGGEIALESEPGKGTTARITLPLLPHPAEVQEKQALAS